MRRCLSVTIPLAAIGLAVLGLYTPWLQVLPDSGATPLPLGYAPIWSTRFATMPGARIDATRFEVYASIILFMSLVIGLCAYLYAKPSDEKKG
ncbi:MAG TPA: hypothetical protein VN862_07745 [Candidatus Acidoferrales bacterium]|nr:hypothetical protein [Candidatus Acidoferrales bacterium]